MDEKFLNKIVELQNLFDEGVLTTADNIPQPEPRQDVVDREAINRFMRDNPMADGGRIGFKDGLSAKVIKEKFPTYFDPSYTGNLGDVNTIKKVLNLYTKKKMGSILIQKELAEQGIKACNAAIRRLVKLAVDQ